MLVVDVQKKLLEALQSLPFRVKLPSPSPLVSCRHNDVEARPNEKSATVFHQSITDQIANNFTSGATRTSDNKSVGSGQHARHKQSSYPTKYDLHRVMGKRLFDLKPLNP